MRIITEIEATWVPWEDGELLIVASNNKQVKKKRLAAMHPYRQFFENQGKSDRKKKGLSVEKAMEIDDELMRFNSEHVLKDWRGEDGGPVKDQNGKEIAYTQELGYKAFIADEELYDHVVKSAKELASIRKDQIESDAKKSQNTSDGSEKSTQQIQS